MGWWNRRVRDRAEHIAHDYDTLPSSKAEAFWAAIWNGVIVGTMVLVMEYAVFSPLWRHAILPMWEWITR